MHYLDGGNTRTKSITHHLDEMWEMLSEPIGPDNTVLSHITARKVFVTEKLGEWETLASREDGR